MKSIGTSILGKGRALEQFNWLHFQQKRIVFYTYLNGNFTIK